MIADFELLLRRLFADAARFGAPLQVDVRAIVEHILREDQRDIVSDSRRNARVVNSIIAPSVTIGDFALIRNSVIAEGCVVGAHAQVNWSYIGAGSELPHMNNVGYSILGRAVLLGAGTVTSSRRLDGMPPRIYLPNGRLLVASRDRLGALAGDGSRVGSLVCLNPFTVLSAGARVNPVQSVCGYVEFSG